MRLVKIRAYVNQQSNMDQICALTCGRVFPFMIFKIEHMKKPCILEIDVLQGHLQVTQCLDAKVILRLHRGEVNGTYEDEDDDTKLITIFLRYANGSEIDTFEFKPFYTSHDQAIIKVIDLFVQFPKIYVFNRREIDWPDSTQEPMLFNHKKTTDLSQHDGLTIFEDDRVFPIMSGFKGPGHFMDKGKQLFIVHMIMGPKLVLFARDEQFKEIFDLIVVTKEGPQMDFKDDILSVRENGRDIFVKLFDPSQGPNCLTLLNDYKTSYKMQYECNTFETVSFPGNYEESIRQLLQALERHKLKLDEVEDGEEDDSGEDEGSDFEGYDYDYDQ